MKRLNELLSRVDKFMDDSVDTNSALIKWLIKHPNPKDSDVHDYADKMDKEIHGFEAEFYKLASIGALIMHKEYDFSKFDKAELSMGIKVEMEHLPDYGDERLTELVASIIAAAHLTEFKDYYTRLKKVEQK